ncbi:TPA: hypothetical protein ACX6PX_000484 [Photobacterium damselae]
MRPPPTRLDVSQALNVINNWKSDNIETLSDLLPIELIDEAYALTNTILRGAFLA